jgi:hypothetical protein
MGRRLLSNVGVVGTGSAGLRRYGINPREGRFLFRRLHWKILDNSDPGGTALISSIAQGSETLGPDALGNAMGTLPHPVS